MRAIRKARAFTSAGRFSPLGPVQSLFEVIGYPGKCTFDGNNVLFLEKSTHHHR
jgi:hypothetical protein